METGQSHNPAEAWKGTTCRCELPSNITSECMLQVARTDCPPENQPGRRRSSQRGSIGFSTWQMHKRPGYSTDNIHWERIPEEPQDRNGFLRPHSRIWYHMAHRFTCKTVQVSPVLVCSHSWIAAKKPSLPGPHGWWYQFLAHSQKRPTSRVRSGPYII